MERVGFFLYLIFIISWFLRLTARFPFLGELRFDLILAALIFFIYFIFSDKSNVKGLNNLCYKRLLLFIVVVILITPFAEWPGSAIKFGIPNLIKAIVFFFFTVWFVQTESRLKLFIGTFLFCQSFRVLEPLYLHLTQGYWGSFASMANWQYMYRLSGAPYDTVNPNGLAFVILTILPFLMYLIRENVFWKWFSIIFIPASLYALYLTGSRSGMLGLVVILFIYILQSKRKVTLMISFFFLGVIAFSNMEGNFKDRYLSIVSSEADNAATTQTRVQGIKDDFLVGFRKPLTGHGLGTSFEANSNYGSRAQVSHNIYSEIFQEIGIIGLCIFILFIVSIFKNLFSKQPGSLYEQRIKSSVMIFASMNIFFGIASYGLSSYEWYFIGALSVLLAR